MIYLVENSVLSLSVEMIDKRKLFILSTLAFNSQVYGEKAIEVDAPEPGAPKIEYRAWNPFRSKLAAGVLGGIDKIHMNPGQKVRILTHTIRDCVDYCLMDGNDAMKIWMIADRGSFGAVFEKLGGSKGRNDDDINDGWRLLVVGI